jgi:hypothetical protein
LIEEFLSADVSSKPKPVTETAADAASTMIGA